MAAKLNLKSFLEQNCLSFESFIKDYINENLDVDELEDVACASIKKVINSIKYWTPKMQKIDQSVMVLFTTLAIPPVNKVSFLNIFKALKDIIDLTKIKQLYIPENRNFIGIEFYNQVDCDIVKNNFKMVDQAYIVHTCWIQESKIHQGRVHWLPMNIEKQKVGEFLNKFFIIKELDSAKMLLDDNVYAATNVFEFKALLRNNVELDNIPHLFEIDNQKALLTIKNRKPLCTNCKKIGHLRKDCLYFYCFKCKLDVLKNHDCHMFKEELSYANIIRRTFKESDNDKSEIVSDNKDIKGGSLVESDTDSWLVVNRNNGSSYSKKPMVNNIEKVPSENASHDDLCIEKKASISENMEEEEMVLSDGALLPSVGGIPLKRKLENLAVMNDFGVPNQSKKFDEEKMKKMSFVDSNPYELLSTDESETY